jgi:hypothetical protein
MIRSHRSYPQLLLPLPLRRHVPKLPERMRTPRGGWLLLRWSRASASAGWVQGTGWVEGSYNDWQGCALSSLPPIWRCLLDEGCANAHKLPSPCQTPLQAASWGQIEVTGWSVVRVTRSPGSGQQQTTSRGARQWQAMRAGSGHQQLVTWGAADSIPTKAASRRRVESRWRTSMAGINMLSKFLEREAELH